MPFAICLPHPHPPPICLGLVHAELGLAPFWKMTVFLFFWQGKGGQDSLPRSGLVGSGVYLLLLVLTLPLLPESLRVSCTEDENEEWVLTRRTLETEPHAETSENCFWVTEQPSGGKRKRESWDWTSFVSGSETRVEERGPQLPTSQGLRCYALSVGSL